MTKLKRITIFVLHHDDASDYEWVAAWIIKWKSEFKLTVHDYSSGGWEHLWNIETIQEAVDEVPQDYLCSSEWATPDIFKAEK
jgi:hypothetical protein